MDDVGRHGAVEWMYSKLAVERAAVKASWVVYSMQWHMDHRSGGVAVKISYI